MRTLSNKQLNALQGNGARVAPVQKKEKQPPPPKPIDNQVKQQVDAMYTLATTTTANVDKVISELQKKVESIDIIRDAKGQLSKLKLNY